DCAERIKEAVEEDLGQLIATPKVFIDEPGIEGGSDWEKTLQKALCRSVAMVAVCAQVYFHPDRPWCGREWAAMEHLSRKRLGGKDFYTIIPLVYRETRPMPPVSAKVQYIDIS